MPLKRKRIHDDDNEELDTHIDSAEDEDVPCEEDDEPQKKGKGKARANRTGTGSSSKGKGKQLPETDEEEAGAGKDDDEIKGYEEQNSALCQEIAQLEELLRQSKRDADQAARPQATAGSGPSNTNKNQQPSSKKTRPTDTSNQPPNADTGPSKKSKKPPFNAAPCSPGLKGRGKGKAGSNDDDDESKRVPLPERKENLTIEAIRCHLGLSDSHEDHLTWLEWRELIRTWSSMANLDFNLTWKQQDKGRVGTLVTLIRDRIPAFQRFVSNWGAEYLVQDCFNHRRGHRLSKARNPSSDRPKKKRRTTTTKTSKKASNHPKEGPKAPRSNEAPPRRPTPQPIPRPPPPQSMDTEQRTRGATNPPSGNRGTPPTGEQTEEQDDAHPDRRPNAGDGHRGRRGRGLDFGDRPPPSMNTRSRAKKNPPVEDGSDEEE